jgi:hypothetical protein
VNGVSWLALVELYEYKVADVLSDREPRGGRRSLRDLRVSLMTAPLSGQVLKRFRLADKALREATQTSTETTNQATLEPEALEVNLSLSGNMKFTASGTLEPVSNEPDAPLDEEGQVLADLAHNAWRADFEEDLRSQATRLRAEQGRPTARILYATLHNLDQYAETEDFASDLNLAKFRTISRVPPVDDPLASFNDVQVIETLLEDVATRLVEFKRIHPKLQLNETEALSYLRRFALAVAEDSNAGEMSSALGPSAREINAAIDSARREQLSPEAKRSLIERLQQQLQVAANREREFTRSQAEEKKALKAAIDAMFTWLAERLPSRYGGRAKAAIAPTHVMGALNDERKLEQPARGATELALRLTRSGGVVFGQTQVGWRNAPEGWVLEVAGAEYPLKHGLRIPAEGTEIRVYATPTNPPYVLLQSRTRGGSGLWDLLALSRAVAALLEPQHAFLHLRLARATVSWLRDRRIAADQHSPETAERYAQAADDSLTAFARGGAEKLIERFRRTKEPDIVERAFWAAADTLAEVEALEAAKYLTTIFRNALEPKEPALVDGLEIRSPGEAILIPYRGEPVTSRVMGRVFTVRTDNLGRVYALLPGGGGHVLEDVLPQVLPGGYALLAREGLRITISYATYRVPG